MDSEWILTREQWNTRSKAQNKIGIRNLSRPERPYRQFDEPNIAITEERCAQGLSGDEVCGIAQCRHQSQGTTTGFWGNNPLIMLCNKTILWLNVYILPSRSLTNIGVRNISKLSGFWKIYRTFQSVSINLISFISSQTKFPMEKIWFNLFLLG
jgi:hypothetical protein